MQNFIPQWGFWAGNKYLGSVLAYSELSALHSAADQGILDVLLLDPSESKMDEGLYLGREMREYNETLLSIEILNDLPTVTPTVGKNNKKYS